MQELLQYIINGILGHSDFEILETQEDGRAVLTIKTKPENIGLVVGKEGRTIKAIQELVRVRGKKENQNVYIRVEEI